MKQIHRSGYPDEQPTLFPQELFRLFAETGRKIKEISRQIGALGNRLGEFVEEMVRPAAVRLFRERGIEVHEVHRQVMADRPCVAMEPV